MDLIFANKNNLSKISNEILFKLEKYNKIKD